MSHRTGGIRVFPNKATIIPSGREPTRVRINIPQVFTMPLDIVATMTSNVIFPVVNSIIIPFYLQWAFAPAGSVFKV